MKPLSLTVTVACSLVVIAGCNAEIATASDTDLPVPTNAWSLEQEPNAAALADYRIDGYTDENWAPLDDLSLHPKNLIAQSLSSVVLAVPVRVDANHAVAATESSEAVVYTPVTAIVVETVRQGTGASAPRLGAGDVVTFGVLGGVAGGQLYLSSYSTYDKAALAAGGVFALELVSHEDYPGVDVDFWMQRGFKLSDGALTSLQLGESADPRTAARTVAVGVLTSLDSELTVPTVARLATGVDARVAAALKLAQTRDP